jgi:hypothetical protein
MPKLPNPKGGRPKKTPSLQRKVTPELDGVDTAPRRGSPHRPRAGDFQRFGQPDVAFIACLVGAARSPSTQSASSATSALALAPTPPRYLHGPADCAVFCSNPLAYVAPLRIALLPAEARTTDSRRSESESITT